MKNGFVKVAAATPEIRVADCEFNARKTVEAMTRAAELGVKILVLPELGLTGYTCGDLFLQPTLLDGAAEALRSVCRASRKLDLITVVGLPLSVGGRLYNCAAVVSGGAVNGIVPKTHVPNYNEFYELRHFSPALEKNVAVDFRMSPVPFGGRLLFSSPSYPELKLGVEICEDLWAPNPPSIAHAMAGATVIVNLSASSETVGKDDYRRALVTGQSARLMCGYVYADAGFGESTTDMVFAGHNIIAENGAMLAESADFSGQMAVSEIDVFKLEAERRKVNTFGFDDTGYTLINVELTLGDAELTRPVPRQPFVPAGPELKKRCERILSIQTSGLKKRLSATGAKTVVVGLSGGLDSTLALLVAARALDGLGLDRSEITAVTMPCFGTTRRTLDNARTLASGMGARLLEIDISESVLSHFNDIGHSPDDHSVVYENAQARERTQVLMDLANQEGGLVVGTGDLSELALGWATYNGDHMSMYGVNSGVPKTLVRHIVKYCADTSDTREMKGVLLDILETPVSPELLPPLQGEISQKTEDLVGPYELHDFFLYYAIRWAFGPTKVYYLANHAFFGIYDSETVLKWLKVFYSRFFAQQFKRSCLPDGPKVGTVTLSPRGDWRMPSDASAALWMEELESLKVNN